MEEGVQVFGVYDGHGGNEVSAYIKDNLPIVLKQSKYFE
jgi:serine/threonine protein phosphatase PrpC